MRPQKRIKIFLDILRREWEKDPDLRFTQFLFNHELVNTDIDYQIEEWELLRRMFPEINPNTYTLWGSFGKSGHEKLKYTLLKDLETEHIKNILRDVKKIKGHPIEKLLKKELKNRSKDVLTK